MPNIGEVVTIADIEWVVLDKNDDAVLCLAKDCVYKKMRFGDKNSNYANSYIREKLNEDLLPRIINSVGEDALFDTVINLLTENGYDDYRAVIDKVGILTLDMYRMYGRIIRNHEIDSECWLATAASVDGESHGGLLLTVGNSDGIGWGNYRSEHAVRPFCIFRASVIKAN